MTKAAYRELRKELLLKALEKFPDLDMAFDAATRMEKFVLGGSSPEHTQQTDLASAGILRKDMSEISADHQTVPEHVLERCRSSSRRRWQESEDAQLRQLCDQGYTVKEIAKQLERTPASVYGRMRQYGLSITPRPRHHRQSIPSPEQKLADESRTESTHIGALRNSTSKKQAGHYRSSRKNDSSVAIDEVIHFLRTRDYSVVYAEDGYFKVDGRQVMTALELFRRANRVRQSLGKSPWTALHEVPITENAKADHNHQNPKRNGLGKNKR